MVRPRWLLLLPVVALVAIGTACGGGGGSSSTANATRPDL